MRLSDRLTGVLAAAGGAAMIYGASLFHSIPGQQFGSGFFPTLVGGALVAVGSLIAIAAPRGEALLSAPDWMVDRRIIAAAAIPAAILFWLVAAPHLGFLPTTALTIAVVSIAIGGRWLQALVIGAVMAMALYAVFGALLRVPLPFGILERALL